MTDLSGASVSPPKPAAPPTGGNTNALGAGLGTDMSPLINQRLAVGQKEAQGVGELGPMTAAQKVREAQGNADVAGKVADTAHQQTGALDQQLQDNPLPTYIPTQDNAQDIASMFGLIGVIGSVLGAAGGGKQSGLTAMGAMTGMLDGWQQGKKDLYEKNRADFEESLKDMEAKQKSLIDAYNRNLALLPYDAAKANSEMQIDLAKFSSPLIAKQFQVQGWDALGKTIDSLIKAQTDLEKLRFEQEKATMPGGGRGSIYGTLYTNNLATAANEISASIQNITTAPAATSGLFQGRNTTGLMDAPLGVLTNKLTTQATQMYNNEMQSLGRNIARIQAGGRQPPESTQKDFENQFTIRENDGPGTVLEKLARARQATERAIQVQIVSPLATPALVQIYAQILTQIKQDIPFTVEDVNNFVKMKDKQMTFGEFMQKQQAAGLGGAAPAASSKFEVGKTYTDANGNSATYLGGDPSDPKSWKE